MHELELEIKLTLKNINQSSHTLITGRKLRIRSRRPRTIPLQTPIAPMGRRNHQLRQQRPPRSTLHGPRPAKDRFRKEKRIDYEHSRTAAGASEEFDGLSIGEYDAGLDCAAWGWGWGWGGRW